MGIATRSLPYADDVPLTGVLAWDDAVSATRPGILVVHGGAGLDDHARNRARRFAELGFVVFACDMYGDGVAGDRQRVMSCIKELHGNQARLARRAEAGLAMLAAQPQVDGRFAAVGYCFGGMTVLELARAGATVAGVVSVHGSLHTAQPAEPGKVKAKVLVCHGGRDPHVPLAHVTAFMEEMNNAGADWQLIAYGRAMHGFTHEGASPSSTPGVAYDRLTDDRSTEAITSFLEELFSGDQTRD